MQFNCGTITNLPEQKGFSFQPPHFKGISTINDVNWDLFVEDIEMRLLHSEEAIRQLMQKMTMLETTLSGDFTLETTCTGDPTV